MAFKKSAPALHRFSLATIADKAPEIVELRARHAALQAQKSDLQAELQNALYNHATIAEAADDRARVLLGDDMEERPLAFDARSTAARIAGEISDHNRALEMLEARLRAAEHSAAKAIVADALPEYRARVTALCRALLTAREAQVAVEEIEAALRSAAADRVSRAEFVHHAKSLLGSPHEKESRLARFLRDAAASGHFDRSEIPEAIR